MAGRVFVIGDTHFGHHNIIKFAPERHIFDTIEAHDDELVRRWNDTVGPKDVVWHLGDVLFGTRSFEHLAKLNGIKKLVGGNHDMYATQRYLEHFNVVVGAVDVRGFILTHIPVHPSQFTRFEGNIHGHLHSKKIDDPRYVCVSAEHTDLRPKPIDLVISEFYALNGGIPK